ncbi:MAG TPA: hypothetical protein VLW65_04805 [Bryobacteraceae bacterium]|nr:hypothetical protein [Bryobacteraceae bacterium]
MKKISGLMAVLVAAGALAVPAVAGCVGYTTYYNYPVVRHEVPVRHEVRRDVRPIRGQYERR